MLIPADGAITPLVYADGYGAAVAYNSSRQRSFTMGFPFECIKSEPVRVAIMQGILNYLIQ